MNPSRKDAKAQRRAFKNSSVCFAYLGDSAPLRGIVLAFQESLHGYKGASECTARLLRVTFKQFYQQAVLGTNPGYPAPIEGHGWRCNCNHH